MSAESPTPTTIDDDPLGWGFWNEPELVLRGLSHMLGTGRIPPKSELENIDPLWEKDILLAHRIYRWDKGQKSDPTANWSQDHERLF